MTLGPDEHARRQSHKFAVDAVLDLPTDGSPQPPGGQRGVRGVKQSPVADVTHKLEQSGEVCTFDCASTLTALEAAG